MPDLVKTSLSSKVVHAFFWNALLIPLAGVASLLGSAAVGRTLPLHEYAVFAVATSLTQALLLYSDVGISVSASKFFPEINVLQGRVGVKRFLSRLLVGKAIVFGLLLGALSLLSSSFARLLGIEEGFVFIFPYVGVVAWLEALAGVFGSLLSSLFDQKRVNSINGIISIARPLLIIAFVVTGFGVWGILSAMIIASFIKLGLLAITGLRYSLEEKPYVEIPDLPRRFIKLSLFGYIEKITSYLHSGSFVTLMLAMYLPRQDVAFFALAADFVSKFLTLTISPLQGIILPMFTAVYADGDSSKKDRTFSYTVKILTLLCFPMAAILIGSSPSLIPWLYSAKFGPAVPIAQILTLFFFLEYTIYGPANAALLSGENLKHLLWAKSISLVSAPLFLLIIPTFGLYGTALYLGGARLLLVTALFLVAVHLHQFTPPARFIGKMALCALFVSFVLLLVARGHWVWDVVVGVGASLTSVKLLRLFEVHEKIFLADSVGNPLARRLLMKVL